jgi:hypothetical protein
MVKFRDAVLAIALAAGGTGCATFCDECDDFPVPGGPGGYSLMPGSYTGPPIESAPGPGATGPARPAGAAGAGAAGAAAPAAPAGAATGTGEAVATPPVAPAAPAPR